MAADTIPSAFIKDADFERVAHTFSVSLASPDIEKTEHLLKQLRNLFVLSLELRRIAVDNGLHLRILEILRLPDVTIGARSEALLLLTCLYKSNLLTPENFPVSSPEFLSLVYVGFFVKNNSDYVLKSKLACLLALLHHSYVNPSFLLLDLNKNDAAGSGCPQQQLHQQNWFSALVSSISRSEDDMDVAAPSNSSCHSNSGSSEHISLCLILQIIARGCQDEHVRDACLSFPSLVHTLASLLLSSQSPGGVSGANISTSARICAIDCLAALCHKSQQNALAIFKYSFPHLTASSTTNQHQQQRQQQSVFVQALLTYSNRDFPLALQLSALKGLVYICESLQSLDVWCEFPAPIASRICENLVRLLRPDRPPQVRVEAAVILTEFVETGIGLQRITGICDGLLAVIATTLSAAMSSSSSSSSSGSSSSSAGSSTAKPQDAMKRNGGGNDAILDLEKVKSSLNGSFSDDIDRADDLTAPFLHLLASITANDEYLRRKFSDSAELVSAVMASVRSISQRVQLAGLRCLLSLSRSAYQLRTTFSDHQSSLSKDLMNLMKTTPDTQVLAACLAVLCNLFLSTASVKRSFTGTDNVHEFLSRIVAFTSHADLQVRINAVWALMNLTYQGTPTLKHQVYSCLSREHLFTLLSDSKVSQVVTCALGLLRNLIDGSGADVDTGMTHYGDQVVQSAIWILEGDYAVEVKEQVLRIIANMASGERSRDALLGNDDLLRKVMDYMLHVNLNVQIAAVDALTNLTLDAEAGDYVGSLKRWQILETCGFIRVLNEMLTTTTEMSLFVKVKRLIERFSEHRYGLISS